ncbi:hypothetical protein PybrP1_005391 [[Pythium] brassicae (nom. inval.)]|nr:hypothetical protein PybrP1_005391 [[Pythium] brassicae (nom. inval.)]
MDSAASGGHLEIVKFLHANRSESCTTVAMNGAAGDGHLEVVKRLHANRAEGCTQAAMDKAAKNGHLEIVKWLHENRTEGCSETTMDWAARNGHLDVVKWLHENRTEGCSTSAMDETNSLEILHWLHKNRSEGCTEVAMESAASGGEFENLLFLKQAGIDLFTRAAASVAVSSHQFEIFQWMRANYPDPATFNSLTVMDDELVEKNSAGLLIGSMSSDIDLTMHDDLASNVLTELELMRKVM